MPELIEDVQVDILEVPLKKQWKISLYAATVRHHALVRIRTTSGLEGYGEASPSPAFMGESAHTVKTVIDKHLAPALKGADVTRIGEIHMRMNGAIGGMEAAKSAIDIASYDLAGKAAGLRVCDLIGGPVRERVPVSWVVGIQGDHEAVEEAVRFADMGFNVIKVKVGKDPDRDVRAVEEVWRAIGDRASIRLDANQGYDVSTAIRAIHRIERICPIESVEQPVPRWDVEGLAEVRRAVRTPIMADEAIFGVHDVFKVARARAADIINIKIGKVGGIYPALKVAAVAESAGLKCAVGSNLELGIGAAAGLHFAASAIPVTVAGDLMIGPYLHERDIADRCLERLVMQGESVLPTGAGLGVEACAQW